MGPFSRNRTPLRPGPVLETYASVFLVFIGNARGGDKDHAFVPGF